MARRREATSVEVTARVFDQQAVIPTTLVYEPVDPYAVQVRFQLGGGKKVEWIFARSLLEDGMRRPTGLGDVRVTPMVADGQPMVELALSSDTGSIRIGLPQPAVQSFLRRAAAAVPSGAEGTRINWDLELAMLTGGGPTLTG